VRPGDLIIWDEEANGFKFGVVAGLIIERDYSDDSEPAVLVQFIEPCGSQLHSYLHYYDREIELWAKEGTVRVQRAS
tara:strand:+ start:983 stop:1213 length:231 start_codon:yes stop_codon:yes gene_type:complete